MVGQLLPCRHAQHDAEVSGRDRDAIDGIRIHLPVETINQMQGYLVAKEIQVNPARCSTSFAAAQQAAIKGIRYLQV